MNSDNHKIDDEIDLGVFFRSIIRRKFILSSLSLGGMVYGCFLGISTPPIWRGEFEIVLNKSNSVYGGSLPESQAALLLNRIDAGVGNNKLTTEIKILESPSVLMQTFEFVKNEKLAKQIDYKNISFRNWKNNNFEAKLTKGTSILSVAYQDQDKKLIIPVLKNISKVYQDYSGRNRLRKLELGTQYFEEQIKLFQKKSKISSAKADKYALKHSLNAISSLPVGGNSFSSLIFKIDLEDLRIQTKNNINLFDQKILKIKSMSDNPQEVLGMLFNLNDINRSLGNELQIINSEIASNRAIYKDQSEMLKILYEKRKELVKTIKKQMIGFLNSKIENQQAILKSTERGDEVFPKYKELLKEAQKDLQILNNLEGKYQILKLEKARSEDPWELITKPTLLPEPVDRKVVQNTLFGFLFGTFSAIVIISLLNKLDGKVYDFAKYSNLFGGYSNLELNFISEEDLDEIIELISKTKIKNLKGATFIISVGDIQEKILLDLKSKFKKYLSDMQVKVTKKVGDAFEAENVFILFQKGITTENDLKKYSRNLKILDKSAISIMVIDFIVKN